MLTDTNLFLLNKTQQNVSIQQHPLSGDSFGRNGIRRPQYEKIISYIQWT
jgi:hypothetical protein